MENKSVSTNYSVSSKRVSTGGYSQKLFFTKPPSEFICGLCRKVLDIPVTCRNGHLHCIFCITMHVSEHHECPVCKYIMTEDDLVIMESIHSLILDLDVGCSSLPIGKDSCQWAGKLRDLEGHLLTECNFHLVSCKHKDCSLKVPRREYQDHIHYECFKRPTACKYCAVTYPYDTIHSHENTCDRKSPDFLECLVNLPASWWNDIVGFSERIVPDSVKRS